MTQTETYFIDYFAKNGSFYSCEPIDVDININFESKPTDIITARRDAIKNTLNNRTYKREFNAVVYDDERIIYPLMCPAID